MTAPTPCPACADSAVPGFDCILCRGRGEVPAGVEACTACDGSGRPYKTHHACASCRGDGRQRPPCTVCSEVGLVDGGPCDACDGLGVLVDGEQGGAPLEVALAASLAGAADPVGLRAAARQVLRTRAAARVVGRAVQKAVWRERARAARTGGAR